jgi:ribonuclease HII
MGTTEAGCDEAGRGCLAGPVVAAAVILPQRARIPGLDDSKKLTERKRDQLRVIIEQKAVAWAVCAVSPREIDSINILQASFTAMHRAIQQLTFQPEALLIDGHMFRKYPGIPHTCVIKGDGKYRSIAAASILAKCHRDELMYKLHEVHPEFEWNKNKGYPTKAHREALRRFGPSDHHRRSFTWGIEQTRMRF